MMTVQFNTSPLVQALYYSGVEKTEEQLKDEFKEKNSTLIEGTNAFNTAFKTYQTEFETFKNNISFQKDEFPSLIVRGFKVITDQCTEDQIGKVVEKLKADAEERLKKEKDFKFITKLFHLIGQCFKGHGFKYESEWEMKVAQKLEAAKDRKVYDMLFKAFRSADSTFAFLDQPAFIHLKVNQMNTAQFQWVTNEFFNGGIPIGGSVYKEFYNGLNDEKKEWLMTAILNRSDWAKQVCKIGADQAGDSIWIKNEVPSNLQKKIIEDALPLFLIVKNGEHNPFFHRSAKLLLEKVALPLIDEGNEPSEALLQLTNQGRLERLQLLATPLRYEEDRILTKVEISRLHEKFNFKTDE